MCGLLKIICVLVCLLVIPETTQAQQVGTRGSKAKCKKPAGLEGATYNEGCTQFTCTKAKGKLGIWVDRPNIDDCCYHQATGYQMGDVIDVTVKNCTETSLVCERREGLAAIVACSACTCFQEILTKLDENGQAIDEVKTEVIENGENIQQIIGDILCRVPMDGPTTEITRTKYGYEFFPWISSSSQLIVDVRGDNDANIKFCPCDGCDGYRVLIGGWNNQKSFIRDNEDDENLQTLVDTPDILSTTEYRRFIINLITTPTEFKIEVRKDGDCVSFLERSWEADSKPWPMPSYIAFSGYTDNPMDFIFPALGYSGTVTRNNQIGTIANWGPEYRVALDIMVYSAGSTNENGISNILHFTAGADDYKLGERVPAIFYFNSHFHICSTVGTNGNSCFNYNIEFNKEYHIEIVQANKNEKFYYTVNVDGEEIRNVENTNPLSFEDVKVFAGDNFFPASDASYKNLIWE